MEEHESTGVYNDTNEQKRNRVGKRYPVQNDMNAKPKGKRYKTLASRRKLPKKGKQQQKAKEVDKVKKPRCEQKFRQFRCNMLAFEEVFTKVCKDLDYDTMKKYNLAKGVRDYLLSCLTTSKDGRPHTNSGCVVLIPYWICERSTVLCEIDGRCGMTPCCVNDDEVGKKKAARKNLKKGATAQVKEGASVVAEKGGPVESEEGPLVVTKKGASAQTKEDATTQVEVGGPAESEEGAPVVTKKGATVHAGKGTPVVAEKGATSEAEEDTREGIESFDMTLHGNEKAAAVDDEGETYEEAAANTEEILKKFFNKDKDVDQGGGHEEFASEKMYDPEDFKLYEEFVEKKSKEFPNATSDKELEYWQGLAKARGEMVASAIYSCKSKNDSYVRLWDEREELKRNNKKLKKKLQQKNDYIKKLEYKYKLLLL
ncbi:hypothetical protein ACLB2K_004218 [Fragaria x ananassa]